ncbi:MAG TPA: nitroreductase family deazaflavin-dependent oxidoreductase [Thermodesulfobacteriota bacterium]|nr:nitroreductase family deazaflavin-dependent oxidoreductase [Thermodesulfobacteriota bacterium]
MSIRRRRMNWLDRSLEKFASSRLGTWLFIHVFPYVDRPLLKLSNGRLSIAVGHNIALLITKGARTGKPRSTPLLYVMDGDNIVLIASKGGSTRHPAWYYNLRANPEARVIFQGREDSFIAREARGEERDRLWQKAADYYAGYEDYSKRTGGRQIPVMVLTPKSIRS